MIGGYKLGAETNAWPKIATGLSPQVGVRLRVGFPSLQRSIIGPDLDTRITLLQTKRLLPGEAIHQTDFLDDPLLGKSLDEFR